MVIQDGVSIQRLPVISWVPVSRLRRVEVAVLLAIGAISFRSLTTDT